MKNRNEYGNGLAASVRYYADYVSEGYRNLDSNRKLMVIAGAASILVILVVSLVFLASPHYTPLYTNLNTQDAASIAAYLKNQKIPYQLADEGSTILVPDAQKYQIRLDLANNNLPEGGNTVGFETFNQTHFGMTDTEEKVLYVAALQGELERTISQINGVEGVRVHIVQPEDSLFVQDQKDATASVLLKLTPGYTLQPSQVLGITRLVAYGVEGLKPSNVTVVDTSGNILSDDTQDAGSEQLSTDQMKMKQDYESQLQASIQSMMDRVLGPGKAVVRANATLDFDQIQIDTENYGDKQVASDHTIEETTTNGGTAQGAAGTTSNIPTYPAVTGEGGSQTQSTEQITSYDVDTTTEQQVVAPGQVKQLSLSVVVDGQLDPVQQKQIEDMVASAAGIDPGRGDKLTVAGMPFNNQAATQAQQEIGQEQRDRLYLNAFYILLALIVAFLIYRYAQQSRSLRAQGIPEGVSVGDLLAEKQAAVGFDEVEGSETQKVLERLRELAKNKPDETLVALRSWLASD